MARDRKSDPVLVGEALDVLIQEAADQLVKEKMITADATFGASATVGAYTEYVDIGDYCVWNSEEPDMPCTVPGLLRGYLAVLHERVQVINRAIRNHEAEGKKG